MEKGNVNGKDVKNSSNSRKIIMKVLVKNFDEFFTNFSNTRSQKNELIFDQNEYDFRYFDKFWIIKMHDNMYLRNFLKFLWDYGFRWNESTLNTVLFYLFIPNSRWQFIKTRYFYKSIIKNILLDKWIYMLINVN